MTFSLSIKFVIGVEKQRMNWWFLNLIKKKPLKHWIGTTFFRRWHKEEAQMGLKKNGDFGLDLASASPDPHFG